MSITSTVPNIFVNGEGNPMEADEVIADYDHIINDVNANAVALSIPIIGALPFRNLIEGEITDANKIMANFEFIRSQVNSRASASSSPIVGPFPNLIKNDGGSGSNDADEINENFAHLVSEINANALRAAGDFILVTTAPASFSSIDSGVTWQTKGVPPVVGGFSPGFGVGADGSRLVTVGGDQNWSWSDNEASSWNLITPRVDGFSTFGRAIIWGNGVWVAMYDGLSGALHSIDGINWNAASSPPDSAHTRVIYDGAKFIACKVGSNEFSLSVDGDVWSVVNLPTTQSWSSLVYTGSLYLAVAGYSHGLAGQTATDVGLISSDGISWTQVTLPSVQNWTDVAWTGSLFVAIAGGLVGTNVYATSPDGVNWTQRTLPQSEAWLSLAWNGSGLAVVATSDDCAISDDGINWSIVNIPGSFSGNKMVISSRP